MLGADLVREARRRSGLTQTELAAKADTTQSAIARLENARVDPGFSQVIRLVELCGFRLDVGLDPLDDSDLAQAEANLKRSVEGRIDHLLNGLEFARDLRRAYQKQLGA